MGSHYWGFVEFPWTNQHERSLDTFFLVTINPIAKSKLSESFWLWARIIPEDLHNFTTGRGRHHLRTFSRVFGTFLGKILEEDGSPGIGYVVNGWDSLTTRSLGDETDHHGYWPLQERQVRKFHYYEWFHQTEFEQSKSLSWGSKGTLPMPPPPGNKALLRDY